MSMQILAKEPNWIDEWRKTGGFKSSQVYFNCIDIRRETVHTWPIIYPGKGYALAIVRIPAPDEDSGGDSTDGH